MLNVGEVLDVVAGVQDRQTDTGPTTRRPSTSA